MENKKAELQKKRKEEDEKLAEELKNVEKAYKEVDEKIDKKIRENQSLLDSILSNSMLAQPYIQKAVEAAKAVETASARATGPCIDFNISEYFEELEKKNDLASMEKLVAGIKQIAPKISGKVINAAAKEKCQEIAHNFQELDDIVQNNKGVTRPPGGAAERTEAGQSDGIKKQKTEDEE